MENRIKSRIKKIIKRLIILIIITLMLCLHFSCNNDFSLLTRLTVVKVIELKSNEFIVQFAQNEYKESIANNNFKSNPPCDSFIVKNTHKYILDGYYEIDFKKAGIKSLLHLDNKFKDKIVKYERKSCKK